MAISLTVIIVASYALSIVQTASDPTVAFFSPATRAWELALGALVAVGTRWLLRIPPLIASGMTWAGLAAIGVAAAVFSASTPYPGSLVAVPVVGTAMVIAGGVATPPWAAERLLSLPPFRWLGTISYSLYLWHWPILILAADAAGKSSLPFRQNAGWLIVALGASVATYFLIENPFRRFRLPRIPWAPVALGVVLIAGSVGVVTVQLQVHNADNPEPPTASLIPSGSIPSTSASVVVAGAVKAAPRIRIVPANLKPSLAQADKDWGGPNGPCWPTLGVATVPSCVFGDTHGTHTLVLYGDSHAAMWFDAIDSIAKADHWKLVVLAKGDCPANLLPYENPPGWGAVGGEYTVCDQWHRFAMARIKSVQPDLVIVTQEVRSNPSGKNYSESRWQEALTDTMKQLGVPASKVVVLGNIPILPRSGPQCLSQHSSDVQLCSGQVKSSSEEYINAERTAATKAGARYIDVIPWFCSTTCTAIISHYGVYFDQFHITATYSYFLEDVLAQSLALGPLPRPTTLTTKLVSPPDGTVITHSVALDAVASDPSSDVTKVDFFLAPDGQKPVLVASGKQTLIGWLGILNTAGYASGTYRLRSVAYDDSGRSASSPAATVIIRQPS
jgi:hypothetical protein